MKWEIEEARVIAFLENAAANHDRFNSDPINQRLADIASTSTFCLCFLFNIDPRDAAQILESVVSNKELRAKWGRILFDELTSSK